MGKNPHDNTGDMGSIPGMEGLPWGLSGKEPTTIQETWVPSLVWEDSLEKEWQPIPIFLLGNPMDRGPWRATVHGVTKNRTQLSD